MTGRNLDNQDGSEFLFIPLAPLNHHQQKPTRPPAPPTSAFVAALVVVGVAAALRQTLSVVTDGSWVTTHFAVVQSWAVARGTVSVAAHALRRLLLLLLAGKVPIRTVIHTHTHVEEVELFTVWTRGK